MCVVCVLRRRRSDAFNDLFRRVVSVRIVYVGLLRCWSVAVTVAVAAAAVAVVVRIRAKWMLRGNG